jgi:hypothetical protein
LKASGIIFVTASGNDASLNDSFFVYPSCYNLDNIVSVAATTSSDDLAYYSNYGYLSVDLAAPGTDIYSTYIPSANSYINLSGTSMAAPHVAGALALLKTRQTSESYSALIYRILGGVDVRASLGGKCLTGGRLNLGNALIATTQITPPNDLFANAITIAGWPLTTFGRNLGGTKEPGEPNHAGNSGGASAWWTWTAPSPGPVELTSAKSITTGGAYLNTLLAVYTGSTVDNLILVASNDDGGLNDDGAITSRLVFNALAGTTYRIAVDGYNGVTGLIRLSLSFCPKNDSFSSAYKINGSFIACHEPNLGASKETGEPDHAGNPGGRSVWWSWTAPASGTFKITTDGSNFDTLLALYTGSSFPLVLIAANDNYADARLKDDYGGKTSTLSFTATAGQTYHIAVDGTGGTFGTVILAGGYEFAINQPEFFGPPSEATAISKQGQVTG